MGESFAQIITPILIKDSNALKKLLYLAYSKDNSVYIFFPRTKGYRLDSTKIVDNEFHGEHIINLEKSQRDYHNPKISYHPRSSALHITCFDGTILKTDSRVLDLAENAFCYPLGQIILPKRFILFDGYSKQKYANPFILNEYYENNYALSLEFFIHSKGSYFDLEDFPQIEKRRRPSLYLFNHHLINYSISLLVSTTASDNDSDSGISFALHSCEKAFLYKIVPI